MNLIASLPLRSALAAAALVAVGTLPMTAHAQQVARDAETGQLRALTADEAATLRATAVTRTPRASTLRSAPAQVTLPDGTVMVTADESTMMYSVARINTDGSIDKYCVHGKTEADKLVHARKAGAKPLVAAKNTREVAYEVK